MNQTQIEHVAKLLAKAQAWLPAYKLLKYLTGRRLALKIVNYFIQRSMQ